MMTAARTANRMHYTKKRPVTPQKKMLNKRAQSSSSMGSTNSVSTPDKNLLAIPTDGASLRKRSGSVPAIKMVTLASEWNMKSSHVRALKTTWARLCEPPRSHCKGVVALVERVWCKLETKDPCVREIFYKAAFVDGMNERCERRRSQNSIATLRDHTHFFVSLVSQVVQNLENDPSDMFNHLDKIGRNHSYLKQYGFKSTHWEKVGEYFVDTLVVQDCVRGFPEACRAWTYLVAAIVDRLRAAPRRGSVAIITPKEEVTVAPVRIFASGNIMCPTMRTPRGSMADIYSGCRRGSNEGKTSLEGARRNSGGELIGALPRRASIGELKLAASSSESADSLEVKIAPRRSSATELTSIDETKSAKTPDRKSTPAPTTAPPLNPLQPPRKSVQCPFSAMSILKNMLPGIKPSEAKA